MKTTTNNSDAATLSVIAKKFVLSGNWDLKVEDGKPTFTFVPFFLTLYNSPITFVMSASNIVAGSNSNLVIHGGASGKITCADGSHPQANVAFIINFVNGSAKEIGHWMILMRMLNKYIFYRR